ncbi:S8 family serine peptidase [Streptomyces sp. NPDC001219]
MSFTRTLRAVGGAVVAGALLFGTAPVALADQIRKDQWPLTAFGADDIWKVSTGKGVTVAVIDDPVDGTHPDLEGNVLPGKNLFGGGGTADEAYGKREHGTSMASLIAGHGHGPGGGEGVKGLAPDAKILPVGIDLGDSEKHDNFGDGTKSYAEALRYAVDHGAKIVNMSFEVGPNPSPVEQAAVDYARKKDVLVVAASGNSHSGLVRNPASVPGVLAVGAVDVDLKVWKYSNYGPHIKLLAPGVHIRSAGVEDPYRLANGTSDAAAYVSAAAALLRAKFPDLTAGQIANRLVKSAVVPDDKKSAKLPDPHYGYGTIRPYTALTKDIPPGSKNGPLPALDGGSSPGSAKDAEQGAKIDSDKGMSTGALVGIFAGGAVVLAIVLGIVIVAVRKKNRRNGPPSGGPGGYGGPGGSGGFVPHPPNPNSYQQQPSGPGSYPPAPPTQPPGR